MPDVLPPILAVAPPGALVPMLVYRVGQTPPLIGQTPIYDTVMVPADLNYRGPWAAGASYVFGDLVLFGNPVLLYVAPQPILGALTFDPTIWTPWRRGFLSLDTLNALVASLAPAAPGGLAPQLYKNAGLLMQTTP